MSERTYFSFRYALPGYTFLLIMLAINIEFIILQIDRYSGGATLLGIIIGFLSLLGGNAIGFIISQPWYYIYNYHFKSGKKFLEQSPHKRLNEIIYFTSEPIELLSILTHFLATEAEERVSAYINRLNDMLNSLASITSAIISGLIIGYVLRLKILPILRDYDFLIIGLSLFFTIIIVQNCRQVYREHRSIIRLLIDLKAETARAPRRSTRAHTRA